MAITEPSRNCLRVIEVLPILGSPQLLRENLIPRADAWTARGLPRAEAFDAPLVPRASRIHNPEHPLGPFRGVL